MRSLVLGATKIKFGKSIEVLGTRIFIGYGLTVEFIEYPSMSRILSAKSIHITAMLVSLF